MSAIAISMVFLLLLCCSSICLSIIISAYLFFNKEEQKESKESENKESELVRDPTLMMEPRSKQVYEFYKDDWISINNSTGIRINYEVINNKLYMRLGQLNGDQSDLFLVQTAQLLPENKDLYQLLESNNEGINGNMIVNKGNNDLRLFEIIDKNRMKIGGFEGGFPLPENIYMRVAERDRILKMQEELVEEEI